MTVYINDFLDVTRLQTGKLTLHPSPVSLEKLVDQTVASLYPSAEKKRIHLAQSIQPDLPQVLVDDKRFAQILTNLINNGIKFTPENGEVTVSVSDYSLDERFVLISVKDTGRGIQPEHLPRIFERLYQVKNQDSMTEGGLGLGLNICRELVRLHGGEIWVESQPDKSSTFFFTVPKYHPKETVEVSTEREIVNEEYSHH